MNRLLYVAVPALLLSACGGSPNASAPAAADMPPVAADAEATAPATPTADARPMDEVPVQTVLASGDREYAFANGCKVVLEAKRAVVKQEGASCASHHRDIALLYASAD